MPASKAYRDRLATIPPFYTLVPPRAPSPDPISPPAPDFWQPTIMGTGESGEVVTISAKDRCEHTLLLGKTGQGKSNLMRAWMRQDIAAGRGFCCLDPHGKLLEDVLHDIPAYRQEDVVYLDASDDEWPFGLNFFQCPIGMSAKAKTTLIDQIVQVFKKCWGGVWAQTTEEWLKVIAMTFMDNRRGTMAVIPKLLTEQGYRESYLPRLRDPFARTTWHRALTPRTGELKSEEVTPTLRRMNKFLMNPVVTSIVGQKQTTLDFPRWMAENKIVLIRLPADGEQGIGEEAVELLGTIVMQLILRAAFGRPEGSHLWAVYADEFQHYVTPDMPKIIQNVRKFGVGLFLATQSFANIHEEDIRDTLLGVGSLLCYQVTDKDAKVVAGEFRRGVEMAEDWQADREGNVVYRRPGKTETASRLANLQPLLGKGMCLVKTNRGEFAVGVPNMENRPLPGPIAKRSAIIRQSRARYCRSRQEVEREICDEIVTEEDTGVNDEPPPSFG